MIPALSMAAIDGSRLVQLPPKVGVREEVSPIHKIVSPSTCISGRAITLIGVEGSD